MYYEHPPKKKGLVYRGMSNIEYESAKRNGYFRSSDVVGTYASNDPFTAECYAVYLLPTGKATTQTKPGVVVAFNTRNLEIINSKKLPLFIKNCKKLKVVTKDFPVLYWQILFKKGVSGDDHLIMGSIPFSKAKEIYKFSLGKWVRIK